MAGLKTIFTGALDRIDSTPLEELGALRIELDNAYGERWFRYVQNRTSGTLAADSLVMLDGEAISAITAAANSTNTYALRASGSFVTDKMEVGDMLTVVDDAGAAGAAPEGEYSVITKVAALRVDFSPAISANLAVNDTITFIKRWSVIASAAEICARHCGAVMGALLTESYGWMQTKGIYRGANVVAAGTAIAEGARLVPGTAILVPRGAIAANANDGTDIAEVTIARALQSLASDTVRRKCIVDLQCE